MLDEVLSDLAVDVLGFFENFFKRAVLLEEFNGRFFADAGNAGQIIAGVAAKAFIVGNLRWRNAEFLRHCHLVHHHDVRHSGLEDVNGDIVVDELQKIAVLGVDDDLMTSFAGDLGSRPAHVIGFIAFLLVDKDSELSQEFAGQGHLDDEVGVSRLAVGFVFFIFVVSKGFFADVKTDDDMLSALE